ncbi:XRE family transcriptional regulator [Ruegeria sediminis]|nr:XRE family transcriptional regulator [Ruegeria sediminis]
MGTVGARLKEERERLGLSQIAFADLGGVKKHAQINYESDRRKPDSSYLSLISKEGADVLYILTGKRVDAPRNPTRTEAQMRQTATDIRRSLDQTISIDGSDYATVARFDVEAAAGDGATVGYVENAERIAFRRAWLDRIGVKPKNAALLRARGSSMEPLIWDGDLLMIDTTMTEPRLYRRGRWKGHQDEIFVLELDGDLRVKSVRRPEEDKVVISSENHVRYEPEVYQGDEISRLRFVGKVVWWGHTAV